MVTFQVTRTWKGPVKSEISIYTGEGGGDCGYPFVVGREYLVYAFKAFGTGPPATGICSRTTGLSQAKKDIAALGPGKPLRVKKKSKK